MTTYKKLTWDSYKIQVESAVRDGNGATISTTYATKTEVTTGLGTKLDTSVAASTYLTITDAASTYAPLTKLTDGSVTKVGTANVGTDTKPIKLVAGVPTAVTNDLVDVSSAQTLTGEKTFSANMFLGKTAGTVRDIRCIENSIRTGMIRFDTSAGENDVSIYTFAPGSDSLGSTVSAILHKTATDGWLTTSYRAYDSANVNDVVTIGSLAANPNVVHTTGNESMGGIKTLDNVLLRKTSAIPANFQPTSDIWMNIYNITDSNGTEIMQFYLYITTAGNTYIRARRKVNGAWQNHVNVATLP